MHIELVSAEVVLDLRHKVLRPGRPIEESRYPTDADPRTVHIAARNAYGEVIGVASIAPDPAPQVIESTVTVPAQWRLRGMATADIVRGQGVGTEVLDQGVREAVSRGAELIWCNARVPAEGFYVKSGWVSIGDRFELPNIGSHVVMKLAGLPSQKTANA